MHSFCIAAASTTGPFVLNSFSLAGRTESQLIEDQWHGAYQTPYCGNNMMIRSLRSCTAQAWMLINYNHKLVMLFDQSSKHSPQ